ncbi:MAG TPA: chemotaxis protein CheA [Syntrophales bacterium]|nr:chemotaxis protein CheA [Syntrophales bacterium]
MEGQKISTLIEAMAADFLLLDRREIDIPAAGSFLNILEKIGTEAQALSLEAAVRVVRGLVHLLEKTVMDEVRDKEKGFAVFERGLSLLQEIVGEGARGGVWGNEAAIAAFEGELGELTGYRPPSADAADAADAADGGEGGETPVAEGRILPDHHDEGLLRDFITESLEYIEQIEVNILNLEQSPEDKDYINAVFRPFHSIKGVAGFLNLDIVRNLAHSLENLLDGARNDRIKVTPPVIDVILDGADALKTLIGRVREEMEGRAEPSPLPELGELLERVGQLLRGEVVEPPAKLIGEILVDDGLISKEALKKGLKVVEEEPGKKIGEALIGQKLATPKQVSRALRKQAEQVTDVSTIRVDTRKLDDMIDMVGELVITQAMIQQDISNQLAADRNLMRDISQLFRITSALQRISMSLRMIPIKQSFQRMARLVRDLAREKGKVVSVELIGEETEIDRNMVDEIYNPLVHLVRNAVDHGLETPEERLRAGKTEGGLIQLKAYHRGGNIVIEIADDGRGLDREKIIKKARSQGLVGENEALTDQEVYRLIFSPGLSTAEKITDVSGRGVGMDVVKQAVDKLRGKIEIETLPGKGTTFITSFPLTMAIIDGMIVRVAGQRYILPTTAIRQALRPAREACSHVVGKGEMINVMGRLLPLIRLDELFAAATHRKDPWESIVVVMEGDGRTKAVMVDEILGKAEVVIKSLGEGFKNIKGIAGGAILGDGQVGLIIDAEGLFNLSEGWH